MSKKQENSKENQIPDVTIHDVHDHAFFMSELYAYNNQLDSLLI